MFNISFSIKFLTEERESMNRRLRILRLEVERVENEIQQTDNELMKYFGISIGDRELDRISGNAIKDNVL